MQGWTLREDLNTYGLDHWNTIRSGPSKCVVWRNPQLKLPIPLHVLSMICARPNDGSSGRIIDNFFPHHDLILLLALVDWVFFTSVKDTELQFYVIIVPVIDRIANICWMIICLWKMDNLVCMQNKVKAALLHLNMHGFSDMFLVIVYIH